MDEAEDIAVQEQVAAVSHRPLALRALRWLGGFVALLVALVLALLLFLHSKPGRDYLVDQIASFAPASGLSVEVGRIEGSVLWSATLHDVKFRDAEDTLFLEVPTIDLNWRPLRWFTSGLDIRHLVLTGGTLYAVPVLEPGDPDAPILPDFDIRVDRFVIDDLTVVEGIMGDERVIDFAAEADIRDGLLHLDADGELGGADQFALLVDAEPDGDRFDLDGTWNAPAGGFLATLVGAEDDLAISLDGNGSWTRWEGDLLARQGEIDVLDFDIFNESGQYRLVGTARPGGYLEGMPARALGDEVRLTMSGTLEDSLLEGDFSMQARGLDADGSGAIDLAENTFVDLVLQAQLLDETLFADDVALRGAELTATLDGPFRDLLVPHRLTVREIDAGGVVLTNLLQEGTLSYDGTRFTVPLDAQVQRIVSGNELFDPRLVNGTATGTLVYAGNELLSDDIDLRFPGLTARLGLNSDLGTGVTRLTGPVALADLPFDNIGTVDAGAQIRFSIGGGTPWRLDADLRGRVDEVTNSTLANLAGPDIRFTGGIAIGGDQPLLFRNMNITSAMLSARLDGRVEEGRTTLAGSGRHVDYGPFTVEATLADDGPTATLVFADPLPAAGLADVRVALSPTQDGFRIETSGGSMLGDFDGLLNLVIADGGDTTIAIERLDVAQTRVEGTLALLDGGLAGTLELSRGGIDGTIDLATQGGRQGFTVDITANNASFGGATPLTIARGRIAARGVVGGGSSSINGTASLQGLGYGQLFIARLAAQAEVQDGTGHFDAAIAGRRGSRFELLVNGNVTPESIAVAARGSHAGRDISMPRRAVLTRTADGGWELQRTQFNYGSGAVVARGRFGGDEPMQGRLSLDDMPLELADILGGEIGLGGTASGVVDFASGANGLPTARARLLVDDLTRSSLLLSSQPLDFALVAELSETQLQARGLMSGSGGIAGRLQASISGLPQSGALMDRLYTGRLLGQLRFDGPAEMLWRLAAIDLIDITGDVELAADLRGSLAEPQLRGSLAGSGLRVQSALTGTVLTGVEARGTFAGTRLNLNRFAGTAPGGGAISGSGFIDLSGMSSERGPEIDLRLAARDAAILDLPNMGATVTGPMRIVSNGIGGTIAGRLQVREARWALGRSEALDALPVIEVREINLPGDRTPAGRTSAPWRYLIDVTAPGGIEVDGMGLDSEWGTDSLRIRGTTDDPRLDGDVEIVPRQGFYSFAGVRFDITRGRISFDQGVPIDPRIDLRAETEVDQLAVAVDIRGNASQPEITFSSVPSLPEEELLARLLFGGSITNLSATDALQLGAAVASLRGGGGLGPINQLRNAIGLDRLRIVAADPALDRGTAIALGKNFGRRFYVEIITDGAGYSATDVEFRITSWLNLLASVSTVGRQSVELEYRRDY